MPITPLHLGPGLALKAATAERMSLSVFAVSQVLMDLEVIARLLLGSERLHGFTNTLAGATLVLLPAVLIGRPLAQAFIDSWNRHASPGLRVSDARIGWSAAVGGGMAGVYTHWFFDAMMHADARPYWPLTSTNSMLGWLSIGEVNLACVILLVLGGVALLFRYVRAGVRRAGRQNH